ncbi:unnamed protein product [Urochloa humidicola]
MQAHLKLTSCRSFWYLNGQYNALFPPITQSKTEDFTWAGFPADWADIHGTFSMSPQQHHGNMNGIIEKKRGL